MKALNVDQPWAELILCGSKTIELRKYRTGQRGRIAIRATRTVLEDQCRRFDLVPADLPVGLILGTVQLADVIQLDQLRWIELRAEHLSIAPSAGKWRYGWRLENPHRLETPIFCRALPGMFALPIEIAWLLEKKPDPALLASTGPVGQKRDGSMPFPAHAPISSHFTIA